MNDDHKPTPKPVPQPPIDFDTGQPLSYRLRLASLIRNANKNAQPDGDCAKLANLIQALAVALPQ